MADVQPPPEGNETAVASSGGNETTRSWERPWTLDEMRKGANNWSLAGDAGLLQYLQDFSHKMISRTHEIEKEVEGLVHESKLTSVRVNNVFNDFMMLANTQFVENRVYDDQEETEKSQEDKKPETQEKTREDREKELIPKVTEAIQLGVDVIDKAFEKLDPNVDDSESDDDDESYRVDPILEAKDPYIERSLPYLIGTPNFINDDNVGLKDVSDDESEVDSYSESESEDDKDGASKHDEKESDYSYSDSSSGSDSDKTPKTTKKSKKPALGSDSESSDGDLFGTSTKVKDTDTESDVTDDDDSVDDQEDTKTKSPAAPMDFASELANKLGGGAPKPPSPTLGDDDDVSEDESRKHKKKDKKKKKEKEDKHKEKKKEKQQKMDDDDLFGGPGSSEEDDLFGGGGLFNKKKDKLFGGDSDEDITKKKTTGLSESEEEEIEVKKEKKKRTRTRTTSSGKKIPAGGVAMFGAPQPAAPAPAGGLFDDEDEEDDMFGSVTKKDNSTHKKAPQPKSKSMFDEESDDSVEESQPKKVEAAPKKKFPAGAVPMFGPPGANPLAKALKKQRQDSDEEVDNDWSDGEKSRSGSLRSNQSGASRQSAKISSSQSSNSLFAGDPDDVTTVTKPKSNSISKKAKTTKGLFDEDDEDDLFGVPSKSTPAKVKQEPKKDTKKASLFDGENDDDDLFGVGAPVVVKEPEKKKPPVGGVSMFGGMDPFGKTKTGEAKISPVKKEEPKSEEPIRRPPAKSISMFGDDEQEQDDLFAGGGATKPAQKYVPQQKQQTQSMTKSIFEDDGDLFGEDDSAGIFDKPISAPSQPKKPETKSAVRTTEPVKSNKAPSSSLFSHDDDDDGGDLFGIPTPKTTSVSPSPLDIGGATVTESTDDVTEKQTEPPKKKPPVGGVSMFGGVNPLDALKKNKSSKTGTASSPVKSPLSEESDDDLFGSSSKQSVPKTAPLEVKKQVPDKQASSVSVNPLDDADDDLFSKPVSQKNQGPKMLDQTDSKPPNDDDDLFGQPVHKKDPSQKVLDKLDTKPLSDDDDDMFSVSKKDEKKEPEPTVVSPTSKKPVGGVSMFGGMDPFGGMKKKSTEVPQTAPPKLNSPTEDPFFKDKEKQENILEESSTTSKISESTVPGKIGKLQMGLNFNPAAMLPGAAPPSKEPEPVAIGFDLPAEARPLQSANKDRAKMNKRRPPSRHGRKTTPTATTPSPASPTDDFFNTPSSPVTSPDSDRVPPLVSESPPRVPSPVQQKSDLFGNDDLFGSSSSSSAKPSLERRDTGPDKSSPDDLFSGGVLGGVKTKIKTENTNHFDDLFSPSAANTPKENDNNIENDIFSSVPNPKKSQVKKSSKPVSTIPDDDEDIFAIKKSKPKPKPSPIIDDDDDLFATPTLSKAKTSSTSKAAPQDSQPETQETISTSKLPEAEEKPVATTTEDVDTKTNKPDQKKPVKKPLTKDEDLFADDTDIFNDIPKAKPKEKKTKKKTTTAPKKTIFKDDIDDIFADTSAATKPRDKKKEKKKTTTSKDTKDKPSDDIFDDPLLS